MTESNDTHTDTASPEQKPARCLVPSLLEGSIFGVLFLVVSVCIYGSVQIAMEAGSEWMLGEPLPNLTLAVLSMVVPLFNSSTGAIGFGIFGGLLVGGLRFWFPLPTARSWVRIAALLSAILLLLAAWILAALPMLKVIDMIDTGTYKPTTYRDMEPYPTYPEDDISGDLLKHRR